MVGSKATANMPHAHKSYVGRQDNGYQTSSHKLNVDFKINIIFTNSIQVQNLIQGLRKWHNDILVLTIIKKRSTITACW